MTPPEGNLAMMPGMGNHSRPVTAAEQQDRRKPGGRPAAAGWCFVALIIIGLAAYAGAASYESVWHLFSRHGLPLPRFGPLGLDGGLVGLVTADMLLTWLDEPIGWLRRVTRLFAAGVIAANILAGYPDPVSMSLRPAAAVLFVILVEVVTTVLRRRNQQRREEAGDDSREGIPLARWALAPVSTFRMHRRMKLWRIRSYRVAVDMELSRLEAIDRLAERYGKDWQKKAPRPLVRMLRDGVRMGDALARVAELTAEPEPVPEPRRPAGTGTRNRKRAGSRNRKPAGTGTRNRLPVAAPAVREEVGVDTEAMILDLTERGLSPAEIIVDLVGNGIMSPSAAGAAVGKSDRYGREVYRKYQALAKRARREPAGRDLS
jgi:Protein of unknown function (DUF2637)